MTWRVRALTAGLLLSLVALGFAGAGWWRTAQQLTPQPGPVDIGFAQAMSRHHQQAITLAQLMLDGRPTPLTTLARQIAAAQLLELGEMQGWLKLWGAPVMPLKTPMEWMLLGRTPPDEKLKQYLLDCAASPTGMAGLASDSEVLKLRTLEGRARDQHFLTLMRAHHAGGLPMARFASGEAALPVVRRLALNVVREQSQELFAIERMLLLLEAPVSPSPSPASGAPER